jgi:hypothetical protein
MWSAVREAFVAGMRRGLFGSGDARSMLSDAERETLEGLRTRAPRTDILNMGSLGSPGTIPQVPTVRPPVKPSSSVAPSGSGSVGIRGTFNPLAFDFAAEKMATGGLVTGPTFAMVGEAGPELVIPLDRFERQFGGGPSIVINVSGAIDPEGTARTILRTLRDAERRTGERLTV